MKNLNFSVRSIFEEEGVSAFLKNNLPEMGLLSQNFKKGAILISSLYLFTNLIDFLPTGVFNIKM